MISRIDSAPFSDENARHQQRLKFVRSTEHNLSIHPQRIHCVGVLTTAARSAAGTDAIESLNIAKKPNKLGIHCVCVVPCVYRE